MFSVQAVRNDWINVTFVCIISIYQNECLGLKNKTILAFVVCYVLGVGSVQTAKSTNKNQTYEQTSIKI